MPTLTPRESDLLVAIANSEYRDGGDLSRPVWSNDIALPGVARPSMGGLFASLTVKGLIRCEGTGRDSVVTLTPAGIARFRSLRPAPSCKACGIVRGSFACKGCPNY